ncbi:hypothetical protein ACQJBY_042469 [Aegilops geniculata]
MLSEIYTYGELCKNRKPSLHWVWQLLVLVDATNNGHCWKETKNRKFVCACSNEQAKGRKCPQGFKGDGVHGCKGITNFHDKDDERVDDHQYYKRQGKERAMIGVTVTTEAMVGKDRFRHSGGFHQHY